MFTPLDNLEKSADSGSKYQFGDNQLKPLVNRSLFDLSHLLTTSIDRCGVVYPLTWFETLPGDEHTISVENLIRCLPQVVPLYSRQRLYIYGFYSRYSDLWANFNTFMTKGYNGIREKLIPSLNVHNTKLFGTSASIGAGSLGDSLGLPIGSTFASLTGSDFSVSALPFMMYLRIYRDYFMNKNYHTDDRVLLPDDDSRFRLDDDGDLLSAKDVGCHVSFDFTSQKNDINYYSSSGDITNTPTLVYDSTHNYLNVGLFYHDWADDRFTTAYPWPDGIRGQVPTLESSSSVVFNDSISYFSTSNRDTTSSPFYSDGSGLWPTPIASSSNSKLLSLLNDNTINMGVTMNQIRKLAIAQNELEKLCRTDGSYKMFMSSFFDTSSKNAIEYRPVYIGGCYQDIAYSEVLSTANTTVGSNQSLLGQYAGHGISAQDNGYIGQVSCDDFGIVMLLACIMPETYYCQGINKSWTRLKQTDMYIPERARLGAVPLLNHELFFDTSSSNDNLGLWAYTNPFDEYRYIPNRLSGRIADKSDNSYKIYTQARFFDSLPPLNRQFAETDDVRHDYLYAGTNEPAFTAQFKFNISSLRNLTYKPVPAFLVN